MTVTVVLCGHGKAMSVCQECSKEFPPQLVSWLSYNRFEPKVGTYRVTSIVSCLRRTFYEYTRPVAHTVESLWMKQRGRLLHSITYAFGWRELPVGMSNDCDGEEIRLVGHIDAYDPERGAIYDFKTTSYLRWQLENGKLPHPHHVSQIRAYDILLSRYGVSVNTLELWYMDDRTPPTKIVVARQDITEWMLSRTRTFHRSLRDNREPAREPSFTCKYCPFFDVCKPDVVTP